VRESALQREIRLHLGQKPDLVLWRNNVGRVFDERSQNWIQYGLCPGSADLIGILAGRFFALEIKTKKGRSSKEQTLFRELVNSAGGYCGEARSVDEAEAHYQRAKR
jgi:hypothetical protein